MLKEVKKWNKTFSKKKKPKHKKKMSLNKTTGLKQY